MSVEHVVARWGREAVASKIGANATVRMIRSSRPDHPVRVDTGLSIRLESAICERCNNGWLSRWEGTVGTWLAPAVRGDIIAIADGDMKQRIAAWAIKTALLFVMSLHLQNGEGFVPESNLRWLYAHRDIPLPPPGSQVWLAAVLAGARAAHSTTMWLGTKLENPEAYVTTFTIGHLVVQVFGQDFRGETHYEAVAGGPLNDLRPPSRFLPFMAEVWPDGRPLVVWPLAHLLTEDDLSEFASWPGVGLTRSKLSEFRRGKITPVRTTLETDS